jgi:hypothetical protein
LYRFAFFSFLKLGHVHLTDFNVATVMEDENTLATSMSGTKPYMGKFKWECNLGVVNGKAWPPAQL